MFMLMVMSRPMRHERVLGRDAALRGGSAGAAATARLHVWLRAVQAEFFVTGHVLEASTSLASALFPSGSVHNHEAALHATIAVLQYTRPSDCANTSICRLRAVAASARIFWRLLRQNTISTRPLHSPAPS